MKKLALCLMSASIALVIACQSAEVKTPSAGTGSSSVFVNQANEQLAKIPVSGFGYKSSAVPAQSWDKWAVAAAPVIKGILDKMPEGYVLQVAGHTDGRGPEQPEGAKPGNLKISSDRAKSVYDSLKRKGVTSPKLTYKGVGSSEPLDGVDPNDDSQRRVTFSVIPQ